MLATPVLALRGSAFTLPGELGTIPQQFAQTAKTLEHLLPPARSDLRLVLTHGNGPQIGNILVWVDEGKQRGHRCRWAPAWRIPRAARSA